MTARRVCWRPGDADPRDQAARLAEAVRNPPAAVPRPHVTGELLEAARAQGLRVVERGGRYAIANATTGEVATFAGRTMVELDAVDVERFVRADLHEPEPDRRTAAQLERVGERGRVADALAEPVGQTELEFAAEVIRCSLIAWQRVAPGEFCNSRPIRNGLARFGLDREELLEAALAQLGVERRRCGRGERWRLPR